MKIQSSIELFMQHCKFEKNLSEKTIQFYRIDLLQLKDFLESQDIQEIELVDKYFIKSYIQNLSKFDPRTIKRKIASSKAFLNFLEFEDYIVVNPFRKVRVKIKEPKRLPMVLDFEEVKRLFLLLKGEIINISKTESEKHRNAIRDLSVLELLFATGMRVSELCGLKATDIDLATGNVLIHGKGNKERTIQICNEETINLLSKYYYLHQHRIGKVGFFFISRLDTVLSHQSVRFLISKYCKLANIHKKVTPHTFRHTFATLLLEQDVDIKYIQHFLGHSSINTTQIYTHVNRKKQLEILSTKHPRHLFALESP